MTTKSEGSRGSDDLRRLLLDAALALLQEPETPLELRKVAERAGKSRTAPYLVFGKESEGGGVVALKIAVAAEGALIMSRVMREAAELSTDPIDSFHDVAEAFLRFVEANPRLFRLMYGPEINAIGRLGEGGFRDHPEFQRFLEYRDDAGMVVSKLIETAQQQGLLPEDPAVAGLLSESDGLLDAPGMRSLQIAWATMIGVSVLRQDEMLRAIGWGVSLKTGASVVTESVLGLDPGSTGMAATSFIQSVESWPPPALQASLEDSVTDEDLSIEGDLPIAAPFRSSFAPQASSAASKFADVFESLRDRREPLSAPPEAPREASRVSREEPEPYESLTNVLDSNPGLRRAAYSKKRMESAHILWIDDHPTWIAKLVETLRHLGAHVTVADGTESALAFLSKTQNSSGPPIRVIVSDIARGDQPEEGTRAIPELLEVAPQAQIIFFITASDPAGGIPAGARGITTGTDELLHLILDVLEER